MPSLGKFSYFLLGSECDCRGWGGEMLLKCKDLNVSHFEVAQETRSSWLQSALWDCFGRGISAWRQIGLPKQSHDAL